MLGLRSCVIVTEKMPSPRFVPKDKRYRCLKVECEDHLFGYPGFTRRTQVDQSFC